MESSTNLPGRPVSHLLVPHWHAGYNMAGFLPEVEPDSYASFEAARDSLASEMQRHADEREAWADEHDCDDIPCPTYGDECAAQRAGAIRTERQALLDQDGPEWSATADGLVFCITCCYEVSCFRELVSLVAKERSEPGSALHAFATSGAATTLPWPRPTRPVRPQRQLTSPTSSSCAPTSPRLASAGRNSTGLSTKEEGTASRPAPSGRATGGSARPTCEEEPMPRFPDSLSSPTVVVSKNEPECGDALVKTTGMATVKDDPSSSSFRHRGSRRAERALHLRLLSVAAGLVLAGLAGGACSSPSNDPDAPTTAVPATAAPAVTTTTVKTDEAMVLDAYRRYWDVFIAVGVEMDPADPRLAEVATGEALAQLHRSFAASKVSGEVARGTIDLAPRVDVIQGDEAVVEDCYDSHILGYNRDTGEPRGPDRPDRALVTVGMRREAGIWKVAGIRPEGYGCSPVS